MTLLQVIRRLHLISDREKATNISMLLKAIAREGTIYSPTSKDFISKYNLGSPATVLRSLKALQKKEMIYLDYNSEGTLFYSIYDILFRRWME